MNDGNSLITKPIASNTTLKELEKLGATTLSDIPLVELLSFVRNELLSMAKDNKSCEEEGWGPDVTKAAMLVDEAMDAYLGGFRNLPGFEQFERAACVTAEEEKRDVHDAELAAAVEEAYADGVHETYTKIINKLDEESKSVHARKMQARREHQRDVEIFFSHQWNILRDTIWTVQEMRDEK